VAVFINQRFLQFVKKLLDDNKVVLCPPIALENTPVKNQYNKKGELEWCVVWDILSKEIIQYMRDAFPKDIKNKNDGKLIDFWFSKECPVKIDSKNGFGIWLF
jgi:hypothetical protein